eukprot:8397010-Alexandrium_andersonii.AAC.1
MYSAPAPGHSHTRATACGLHLYLPHPCGICRGAWRLHLCDFGRGVAPARLRSGRGAGICATTVGMPHPCDF